ncbi:MAG TPA: F0F1 ATP synthase subunit epsilon [Nitrospinota bacterium]|nr:F0F1 ATP synthase subunit epsilon [Nitrospinota bacterium]
MKMKISLEILTPDRQLVREEVDTVTAPGVEGEFGVLPGHTYFITKLGIGMASYSVGSEKKHLSISGGIAEIGPDRVNILTDVAEIPEEIDIERAKAAKERAEARLAGKTDEDVDYTRVWAALQKALARIRLASQRKN